MATGRSRPADGVYVPDPERDTATVIDGFFAHLTATLRERSLPEDLAAGMRTRLEELERTRTDMITDDPSRCNLRMTVAMVAAYEALRPRLGRVRRCVHLPAARRRRPALPPGRTPLLLP